MSYQRRNGQHAIVYGRKTIVDARGNSTVKPDLESAHRIRAAFTPESSSRAELPGQQEIDQYRMICTPSLRDVARTWGYVLWDGRMWDITAPPAYRHGIAGTRHISVNIRVRPEGSASG